MRALILVSGCRVPDVNEPVTQDRVADVNEVLGGIEYMPMLVHQIENLHSIGVTHIILAVNSKSEVLERGLQGLEQRFGVTIFCKEEHTNYENGGWLGVMKRDGLLEEDKFFLLQSDVISEYRLRRLQQFHDQHGTEATMAITKVHDPDNYDVVIVDNTTGMVQEVALFPHRSHISEFVTARAYIFNPSVLDRAEPTPMSTVETDILPHLAEEHQLCAMELMGPFINLEQSGFLEGLSSHVRFVRFTNRLPGTASHEAYTLEGKVHIHPNAEIHGPCHIGPDVVIGPNCKVLSGARLTRCVLMRGVTVKEDAVVDGSIILSGATVGEGAVVIDMSVVGELIEVAERVCLSGAVILGKDGFVRRHVINNISYAVPI